MRKCLRALAYKGPERFRVGNTFGEVHPLKGEGYSDGEEKAGVERKRVEYTYLVEAGVAAEKLKYKLVPRHLAKLGEALIFLKSDATAVWSDKCDDMVAFLLRALRDNGPDFTEEEAQLQLPFLVKMRNMSDNHEVQHEVFEIFGRVLLMNMEKTGHLRTFVLFLSARHILETKVGLRLATDLHNYLKKRPDNLEGLTKTELVKIVGIFAVVELGKVKYNTSLAPKWSNEDVSSLTNARRILHRAADQLLAPPVLNALTCTDIVFLSQNFSIAKAVHPTLFKAFLLRMKEPDAYQHLNVSLLVEFVFRIAKANCLHPLLLREAFVPFAKWFKRSHTYSLLLGSDCVLILRAYADLRLKDAQLLDMLAKRILETGVTLRGLASVITYVALLKMNPRCLVDLCEEAIRKNLVDDPLWDVNNMVRTLSHVYKSATMPASVKAWFQLVIAKQSTMQHDLPNTVMLIESMSRVRDVGKHDMDTFESLVRQVVRYLDIAERDPENNAVKNLTERVLATYIWSVAPFKKLHHYMVRALRFLVTSEDLVSSLHPTLLPWVLAAFEHYNGPVELRDLVGKVILDHALQPHVLVEFDAHSVWFLVRVLANANMAEMHEEEVNTLLTRVRQDEQLLDAMTYQVGISLMNELVRLHSNGVLAEPNALPFISDIFKRRISPNLQHVANDPLVALKLFRCASRLRTKDPTILAGLVRLAPDLATCASYSVIQRGHIISTLSLLRVIKPAVMDSVSTLYLSTREALEAKDLKWLLYGIAKCQADFSYFEGLCALAITDSGELRGPYDSPDLTLIFWSLCSARVFPPAFTRLLCDELVALESLSQHPFSHVKRNNMVTILTGLASADTPPQDINKVLELLLRSAVRNDALVSIDYLQMNRLITFLVDRRVECPEFFRAARQAIISRKIEEGVTD